MANKRKSVSTRKGCGAGSRPLKKQDLPLVKEQGAGVQPSDYEAVMLVNLSGKKTSVWYKKSQAVFTALRAADGLHRNMLLSCTDGKTHHYEWSMQEKDTVAFYQTSLVPLCDEQGNITQVLSLTRNISAWGASVAENVLSEKTGARTFAQILLAAREEEKKAICKTLHDEVGSSAVMLSSLVKILESDLEEGTCARGLSDLAELRKQLRGCLERIRNVIVTLRPPSLEFDGALGGSIRELLENTSHYLGIPFEFKYSPRLSERAISDNVKIVLYRVTQEALSNIAKHASAKHITACLKKQKNTLYLTIADDGIGFKVAAQRSINHIGLLAMKDSVRLLGGRISIKSAPGKGTCIAVSCPCVVYEGKSWK